MLGQLVPCGGGDVIPLQAKKLLVEAGYKDGVDITWMVLNASEYRLVAEAAQAMLALPDPPTAVFAANDLSALSIVRVAIERGLRVPADVSVIGYDDTPTAEFAVPRLTSVHMPIREVTQAATRTLLNRCYDLGLGVERQFGVTVTARASLGPAPARRA